MRLESLREVVPFFGATQRVAITHAEPIRHEETSLPGRIGSLFFFDVECRHRFDDRVVVGKCVEGLDEKLTFSSFDMDEADCSEGHSAA